MTRPAARVMAALAVSVVLLVTACTAQEPDAKEAPLEVKTKADVETVIRAQADAIAEITGGKLDGYRANSAPCDDAAGNIADDGTWNLTGFAAIPLASDKHVTTLHAIHDKWQSEGWQIEADRTLPDGIRGTLSGRNPRTGVSVSISSSDPPKQLALIIASSCYRPAPGEDPANQ
jgi:hypothetical protein